MPKIKQLACAVNLLVNTLKDEKMLVLHRIHNTHTRENRRKRKKRKKIVKNIRTAVTEEFILNRYVAKNF